MDTLELTRPGRSARGHAARVVFVDNFFASRGTVRVVPHLGLMSLAAILERAGHQVEIFDPKILFARGRWSAPDARFLDAAAEQLSSRTADLFGFTAYGRSLPFAIKAAERLRAARPSSRIILGGPHPTILGERILGAFDCFDLVARFEAGPFIVPLVEAIVRGEALDGIPNLVFRRGAEIVSTPRSAELPDMDSLPRPSLHLYPIESLGLVDLSIEAGRGCPFTCTFCSTSTFFQRRYRLKSNQRLLDEMEWARRVYGINSFDLNHDLFGLVKESVFEFCALVRGRGFRWRCSMRPDTVDEPLVAALRQAGCVDIYFGVETGSRRLQRAIKKRLDLDTACRTFRCVAEAGISSTASFITGFPEETESDQDETLDLIGDLLAVSPGRIKPQLHVLSPEPGSTLAGQADLRVSFDGIGPEPDEPLDIEMIRSHPDLFSVFYHFESKTERSRVLRASAFVMHLLPALGFALTVHLCHVAFSGRLSALFRAIVEDCPHAELSFGGILSSLERGLDATLRRLPVRFGYLQDLAGLSRSMPLHAASSGGDAMSRGSDDGHRDDLLLIRFAHNVPAIVRAILTSPTSALPQGLADPEETWCVLGSGRSNQPWVARIEPLVGRRLSSKAALRATITAAEQGLAPGPVVLSAEQVENLYEEILMQR